MKNFRTIPNIFYFLIFFFLLISCGKGDERPNITSVVEKESSEPLPSEPEPEPEQEAPTEPSIPDNAMPIIEDQKFIVEENSLIGISLGFISASDPDDDILKFSPSPLREFDIDENTGELKTTGNGDIDFETTEKLSFDISVGDGKLQSKAMVEIAITNVEDGSLTNTQKKFVDEYDYLTNWLDPSVGGAGEEGADLIISKWSGEIRLFLDGNVLEDLRAAIPDELTELNMLFSDGTEIRLVNSIEDSNLHLYQGSKEEIKDFWPDMYDQIVQNQGTLAGLASSDDDDLDNFTDGGRIWMNSYEFSSDLSQNLRLFKHELGHVLGLGHASPAHCEYGDPNLERSIMCNNGTGGDFSAFDEGILRILYHPDIEVGKTFEELKPVVESLILSLELKL